MSTTIEPNLNGHGPHASGTVTAEPAPVVLPDQRDPLGPPPRPMPVVPAPVTQQQRTPVHVLFDEDSGLTASTRPRRLRPKGTGYLPYRYMIGDLISVGSQIPLPELEYFRAPWLGRDLDIEVRVGKVGQARPHHHARLMRFDDPIGVRYEEHFGRLGANFAIDLGERIHVTLSKLLAHSPHVAYTNILEALLRCAIAARGGMLLHSACVEIDGVGVLLSAKTDTGKTGTVLRLLREQNARFLSDDMTILYPDGSVRCYPKPLTISSHTLRAVDPGDMKATEWARLGLKSRLHSKGGRSVGLAIGERNLPIMTANAITQLLVPPPKYDADRLVPCEVLDRTTVSELFIIERGLDDLQDLSIEETCDELVANTDDAYGFPPYRYLAPVLVVGGTEYRLLRDRERQVLNSALRSIRARRLASASFGWADEIPTLIARREDGGAA
jgi:hypothetical protein